MEELVKQNLTNSERAWLPRTQKLRGALRGRGAAPQRATGPAALQGMQI